MILKDTAFAILNNTVPSTPDDVIESFQFVADNGYFEELTASQLLTLRELIETDKVFTPPAMVIIS